MPNVLDCPLHGVKQPSAGAGQSPTQEVDPAEEAALDEELMQLREQVAEEQHACHMLRAQVNAMNADLSRAGKWPQPEAVCKSWRT
jgi:hypothetical protein